MAAHTACEITGIAHEHHLVVGIRSVGRVGKPEVLPHHDAILVASVIKLLVAGHSHPVANHIEVHVAVQAHGNVVFPLAIVEVRLRESPVSAERHDASPVDEKFQLRVRVGISHLPYTCLVVDAGSGVVALLIVCQKLKSGIMQIWFAMSVWPPEAYAPVAQGLVFVGTEHHLSLFSGFQRDILFKLQIAYPSSQRSAHFLVEPVVRQHAWRHGGKGVGQIVETGAYYGVCECYGSSRSKIDIVPDTDITTADS